jgi:hypothetical protein
MDRFFDQLDERWQSLPRRKQHRYTLYLFAGYVLLTAVTVGKVCYDTSRCRNNIVIGHIENPIIQKNGSAKPWQDSLSTILKNNIYERK